MGMAAQIGYLGSLAVTRAVSERERRLHLRLKVMADELVAKCREAGLTHFLFVRHANAAPLESSAPVRTDQPHDWRISISAACSRPRVTGSAKRPERLGSRRCRCARSS